MGWEYLHQVDKIKNKLMAELLFQHVLPKQIILVKTDVFGINNKVKKVQKGPEPPKPILLTNSFFFV